MLISIMSREARALSVFAATAVVLLVGACSEGTTASNTLADKSAPSVSLTAGSSSVDTVISFQVDAKDNLGLKTISVKVTGGLTYAFDTTFTFTPPGGPSMSFTNTDSRPHQTGDVTCVVSGSQTDPQGGTFSISGSVTGTIS